MAIYLFIFFMWLLAGFVAGVTSFGGNLVAVPFITMLIEPRMAILAGCISGTVVFAGLALLYRKGICWRETMMLLAGALAGMPFGIWFLRKAGASAILLAAGVALILFLSWQLFVALISRKTAKPVSSLFGLTFGFISGLMMAAVGMGGPPLVLFAYLRHWSKEATLGTVNAASVAFMFFVLPGQYLSNLYTPEIWKMGLAGALAAVIGILTSVPVVRKLNVSLFRKLLLLMLAISAIILILRAFE